MHSVSVPVNNLAVMSAINYYHMAQKVSYLRSENTVKVRATSADWTDALRALAEAADRGEPILFSYSHGTSAHAIVLKGCVKNLDGSYDIVAYDNRFPNRTVTVKIDRNFTTCIVNRSEVVDYIEYTADMSAFSSVDLDGPQNDYASYPFAVGEGATGGDDGYARISIASSGRVTVKNAEGDTFIYENGAYSGTMVPEDEQFEIADDGLTGSDYSITYTVPDSDYFTFFPENTDLDISVSAAGLAASSETAGASCVLVSKTDGVTAYGEGFTYELSLSVDGGVCDLVEISGTAPGDVTLALADGVITATGVDATGNGKVNVCKNITEVYTFTYRPGYTSFTVIADEDGYGGVAIMGSSNDDGIYDVNIGIPPIEITPGDANEDGKISVNDLKLIKKYISGSVSGDGINFANADVNGDGKINVSDLKAVKGMLAGQPAIQE